MSFLKKMQDKFEDVLGDKNKHKHVAKPSHEVGGHNDKATHSQGMSEGPPSGNEQTRGCGVQPTGPAFPGGPHLPPGWIAQWDPASQRYYYLEQATGRTQWELPNNQGPPAGYHNQQQVNPGSEHKAGEEKKEKKEKGGHGGMLKGAAGGFAAGAFGGAVLGHTLGDDSSDEEHKPHAPAYQPAYGSETRYYPEQTHYGREPVPVTDNTSISSSDREELREDREEYENASGSDKESAREEYEEQYKETYGSD